MNGFVSCDVFVGYRAVYRISFAMAVFFFLFSLLMIQVKTSNDPRASIHNGYVCEPAVWCSTLLLFSSFFAKHSGELFTHTLTASSFFFN